MKRNNMDAGIDEILNELRSKLKSLPELQHKVVIFDEIKEDIVKALNNSLELNDINESVELLNGFIDLDFFTKLSNDPAREDISKMNVPRHTVPMVMVKGEKSGQAYFFCVKALLPELDI